MGAKERLMNGSLLVAVAGAHDIVGAGLRTLLSDASDVMVMETFPAFGTVPDVVVYDAIAVDAEGGTELAALTKDSKPAVVVMSRDLRPDLATRAMACGASGYFSMESDRATVLAMVRAAASGELEAPDHAPVGPGADAGLTGREVQVLCEVVHGMTNHEISRLLGLSGNTIKSHIRSAYRKIGVESRSQAVCWCLLHGFEPLAR
jgi:DNA-binding NarL/FixJ family response regulator